ncbi:hypothetical protein Sjap_009747 [Stephania japonica]|uniref:Flavin-containing monooxygenase n=1 Tax=Stephania japonica TaxID=461633 RepID=A0AAP0J952_9MAGN
MEDATTVELVKGKHVVVVGNQNSGLDIAVECDMANGAEHPCTLIYRTKHWSLPNFTVWGVLIFMLYFNRFSELMLHKPGQGLTYGNAMKSYVKSRYPLKKYDMIPESSLLDNFYDKVEDKSIVLKEAKRFGFCKTGLKIEEDKAPLQADVVILATGYKDDEKLKNIFSSTTLQKRIIGSPTLTVPLYRN